MLQRFVDAAAVEAEIERVRSLSGAALRRRWRAAFGRPLPRSLTVELLRRMIANRIQEEAFGTLDRATLKLLNGLAHRDGAAILDTVRSTLGHQAVGIAQIAKTAGLSRQTIYRIKDDPPSSEAALAAWGL
jgi:DNA-binding phage protein